MIMPLDDHAMHPSIDEQHHTFKQDAGIPESAGSFWRTLVWAAQPT